MGFGKNHGFRKRKGQTKDKLHASFFKERSIAQPNALRKIDAESHHHAVRSPQKRTRIEAAVDLPRDVSPADAEPFAEPFSVAEPSPITETFPVADALSTVELMPRKLRSAKNNN